MGTSYRVDQPTGIVVFQDDGSFDYPDWERTVRAAMDDPATSGRRFLSDRRQVTQPLTLAFLESIQAFLRAHARELGEAQWAVVGRPGATQDALELAEHVMASTRVRVKSFPGIKSALAWLLPISEVLELGRLVWWVDQRESKSI